MTEAALKHYLIVFDASKDDDADVREFRRPGPALDAYREAEELHRLHPSVQVVLLASDSLETVMATHGNYWPRRTGAFDLRPVLRGESARRSPKARVSHRRRRAPA